MISDLIIQIVLISIILPSTILGFVEDYRIDPQIRVPRPAPSSPGPEQNFQLYDHMTSHCDYVCRNGNTCQKLIHILTNEIGNCQTVELLFHCAANQQFELQFTNKEHEEYLRNSYHSHMSYQNGQCSLRIDSCPLGYIPSGFGTNQKERQRCISLVQCKYLQQIYSHVNEIHPKIDWR